MRWMSQLTMRVKMLVHRGRAAAELDAELRDYLDRECAANVARGMSADEARYAALQSFGNPALVRDQAHATWNWSWMDTARHDLRMALRMLRRSPGFTALAVLVMALGIGANVALFTVVRGVLLKPLPFAHPDRLLELYENSGGIFTYNSVSGGMFAGWRRDNHAFSDMALVGYESYSMAGAGGQLPERIHGATCSWNLLPTLGVQPILGRNFTAADDVWNAQGTTLLTWGLWKRRFGGNPAIVNQIIYLNTRPFTVIGVLPQWFAFPDSTVQLLAPVYNDVPPRVISQADNHMFQAVGRLKPGVSIDQGLADLSVISNRMHLQHLDDAFVAKAANVHPLLEHMVGDIQRPLYVLFAATGCVLLITCLNVANLLIARSAARRKEMAIRMALGGGRIRLLRERLAESLLLSIGGGGAGLLIAVALLRWFLHARPEISRADSIHIDGGVVLFTSAVVVFCATFAGVAASFRLGDAKLAVALQDASRGNVGQARMKLRRMLLSVEVGLTVVLLVGAGLLLKSYTNLRSSNLGCSTNNVLTMHLDLFGKRYNDRAQLGTFYAELLSRVRALPGVESAGFVEAVPGQGYWEDTGFAVMEHPPLPPGQAQFAINRFADPHYFQAMGIPILRGRSFDPAKFGDRADEAVISKSFADQYLPGEDPIGKHLRVMGGRSMQIVGVVADVRYAAAEAPKPIQYYSLFNGFQNNGILFVRSRGDVETLGLPVQRIVHSMDRDLPVSDVLTMNQLIGKTMLDASLNATLLVGFAVLSLLLAGVGLFGVLSYIVAQRTSEIGIRMALGASRETILSKVLADGMRPALMGLGAGLLASMVASRVLTDMLYETKPLDGWVYAAVSGTLLLVAMLACMLPAWRACHVDPMRALRME